MTAGTAFAQARTAPAPPPIGWADAAPSARDAAISGMIPGTTAAPAGVPPAASSLVVPPAAASRATPPPTDATALGQQLLNAGPDPRVRLDGRSRDHAAIFGTDDEDEQALLDQERALQAQRDQLKVLERVLNAPPPAADPHPPAMIPLTSAGPMNMPRLLPTPSGSDLDRAGSDSRRSVDEMQRRVNGLRRDADVLRQGGR